MKRLNGLDKDHKPMSVRGGIADILLLMDEGEMLLAYSGGLHHVHYPGKLYPNLFKTIKLKLELKSIIEYKNQFPHDPEDPKIFKNSVITDLETRIKRHSWRLFVWKVATRRIFYHFFVADPLLERSEWTYTQNVLFL